MCFEDDLLNIPGTGLLAYLLFKPEFIRFVHLNTPYTHLSLTLPRKSHYLIVCAVGFQSDLLNIPSTGLLAYLLFEPEFIHFVCLTLHKHLQAIQPSTGDIIYDTFEDSKTRTELCNRLDHLQPVEAVVSPSTSELTTTTITTSATKLEVQKLC